MSSPVRFTTILFLVLTGCLTLAGSEPSDLQYLGDSRDCGRHPGDGLAETSGTFQSTAETLGEQRTLVTLVNFLDDPSTPFTPAEVEFEILDATNPVSTASYVDEASYGRASMTGTVLGWFTMPWDDAVCHIHYDYQKQRIVDELDPLIDFTQYDRWFVVFPPNAACGFAGYSSLGKLDFDTDEGPVQLSRAFLNGLGIGPNLVAVHELGHSLAGLQHSLDYECGAEVIRDECAPSGLGSLRHRYDVMGDTYRGGHFSAANKDLLGWLGTDIVEVTPSGGNFTLLPYESQAAGTKALRIPVSYVTDDIASTRYYYLSYRKPLGFDAGFPELATDGAMLEVDSKRIADDGVRRAWLLDASPHVDADSTSQLTDTEDVLIGVGQTYVDATKGISISVLGVNAGALEVSVSVSKYCGNGVLDPEIGETCDGGDLGGSTCAGIGHLDGLLTCSAGCTLDESRCGMDRCAPGHTFNPDQSCGVTLLADPADGAVWRSQPSFTEARDSAWGSGLVDESWLSVMTKQQASGFSWIHRNLLPFDTTSLPAGATILSAELVLKVVLAGGIINTHPTSADQLVLVHPTPAAAPQATRDDFDQFGALDNPAEGAPRIDVGDELQIGTIKHWALNPTGLGWIDPDGWSLFGIRGGFDTDNVWFPGVDMEFHVQFRSSVSPLYGPRLAVTYASSPVPAVGPAGAAPDGGSRPGKPLSLNKIPGGDLMLDWGASCNGGDSDYAVYEGTLGNFTSHLARSCSTGGATSAAFAPAAGSSYYLIVPRSADREGSYGLDGSQGERPVATSACVPQQPAACAGG